MRLAEWRLKLERRSLIADLPLRSPIFLPTDKVPLPRAVEGLRKVRDLYEWKLDRVHRPRIKALREAMKGRRRCFVIGNGPSLNRTNLSLLADEVTFGVNGFFLMANDLGWFPTFYVVEDHLVAEDRSREINDLLESVKLFPANLAYCLEEDEKTVFFDHRPRISFPHGFDFSMDAARCTYAGCTVTFTCLQLAAYFGFEEIYLVGVDADYQLPDDVQKSDTYGVDVLDMGSDDPNHFNPNYFGKGYRWHDPQVDKMLEAYREAKRVTDRFGIQIANAGVGGKLEVFPRVELESLFDESDEGSGGARVAPVEPGVEDVAAASESGRLAIIDMTLMGDGTATGELKRNLLSDWSEACLLHLFSMGESVGVVGGDSGPQKQAVTPDCAASILSRFEPDCILYRPHPDSPTLRAVALRYLQLHATPLLVWIMDDWPERLRLESPSEFGAVDVELRWLFDRASHRLVISQDMAQAFSNRYGFDFQPVANGVDPKDWPLSQRCFDDGMVVRYAGAIATDMNFDSVVRVAHAVEALAGSGVPIRFEINTRRLWARALVKAVGELSSCNVSTVGLSVREYREFLRTADVLLIAYNFDEASKTYVRYSLANKLPECLVSGSVTLVHGPSDIATVKTVSEHIPGVVVSQPDTEKLLEWLETIFHSPEHYDQLAMSCRHLAETQYCLNVQKSSLASLIRHAQHDVYMGPIRYYDPEDHAWLDETKFVAKVLSRTVDRSEYRVLEVDPKQIDSLFEGLREESSELVAIGSAPPRYHAVRSSFDLEMAEDAVSNWRHCAQLLLDEGYHVYLSEWFSFDRRTAKGAWRSIRRYPCNPHEGGARGTLFAFSQDPPAAVISEALDELVVSSPRKALTVRKRAARPSLSYAGLAGAVRGRSERLFRVGQFIMWFVRSARSRPLRFFLLVLVPVSAVLVSLWSGVGLGVPLLLAGVFGACGIATFVGLTTAEYRAAARRPVE